MSQQKITLMVMFALTALSTVYAQSVKVQQGLLLKSGTNIRLGSVQILNRRNLARAQSNAIGVFNIQAAPGDTLYFTCGNFQSIAFVVTNLADKILYMEPMIELDEVVVKETSLKNDIKEVQRGYREKSVFYTGTPHYYYLVLKPMTFIYENFKSEVIEARRFNRFARRELASYQVNERFNDVTIKKVIPITDSELDDFKMTYMPTLKQINAWDDYDLINYIKSSYKDFKASHYHFINLNKPK